MNALCYKVIFSKRLGALVAVGEHAVSQGKSANGVGNRSTSQPDSGSGNGTDINFVGTLKSIFAASALTCLTASHAWAAPAVNTLPTNGVVQTGAATVSTNGAAMTINQTTNKASINWNSFSIGSAASVNVVQNGASSVLLNRVVGNDPSQIFGKLTANGQVILINPNGIVLGKGGSVVASAFTASTFGMTDASFQNGKYQFNRNGSTAGVTVEQGASIQSTVPGGYVALLGANVNNQGEIHTQQGAVVMAAGEGTTLPSALTNSVGIPLSTKVRLELAPSTINASVENGGVITTEGGQVLMQAAAVADAVASVTQTGHIDTTGAHGGAVTLLAEHGYIKVTGNITANSTDADNKGADIIIGRDETTGALSDTTDVSGAKLESQGGFVETSGRWLATTGARVKAKDWLLDPSNITIGPGSASPTRPDYSNYTPGTTSTILASDIEANLNIGTDVKISTGAGTTGDAGNITVASNINKSAGTAATLTLEANNNISFSSGVKITDTGSGNLGVHLIANGARANGTSIYMNGGSAVDVGGSLVLDATAKAGGGLNNSAIYMAQGSLNQAENNSGTRTLLRGSNVTLNMNLSGNNQWGLFTQHAVGIEATTGDANLTATYSGALSSSGVAVYMGSGWNGVYAPAAEYVKASNGAITIQSNVTGTSADGKFNFAGTTLSAKNNISLKANITNATQNAILVGNEFNNPKIQSSTGDILIQGNTGGINIYSLTAGAISGKNITIDNTGSTLASRDSNGNYTKGSGAFTATSGSAVNIQGSGAGIQATGNLDIIGVSNASGSSGVVQTGTNISGSRVSIQGENLGTGLGSTNGFYNTGTITSTGTDVYIRGASKKDNALSLQGAITAKTDTTLIGVAGDSSNTATSWGVYLNKTVTAQTGNISLTGSTTNTNVGVPDVKLDSGANLVTNTTGKNITIAADTIDIHTSAASINAGTTGTVTISNNTAGTKIDLGGSNAVASNGVKTLGLNKAQLDRVTAATTTIGSVNAGDITVSQSLTTADNTGHMNLTSGGNVNINNNLKVGTTVSKNLTIKATNGAVTTATAAAITANTLDIAAKSIGTSNNRLNTSVVKLQTASTDDQYITEADQIRVVATASKGNIDIATTNGELTVDTDGITATNGSIKLSGINSGSTGHGIQVLGEILADKGDVTLYGETKADSTAIPYAGIKNSNTIKGLNIDLTAKSTNITSNALGYYGAGGNINATNKLKVLGTTNTSATTNGDGFYTYGGSITAGGNLSIEGSSNTGAIGLDNSATVKSTNGSVSVTAAKGDINAGSGNNQIETAGDILIKAGTDKDSTGKIDGKTLTVTQNGDAKTTITTTGLGNVMTPKIVNKGSGNVVVAAGSEIDAGTGGGGQVKTWQGNNIDNQKGKTYIYSGNAANTGLLSNLDGSFSELRLSGDMGTNAQPLLQNADSNVKYATDKSIAGGANAQVMFREKISLDTSSISGGTVGLEYGNSATKQGSEVDLLAAVKSQLKQNNLEQIITRISSNTNGANVFKISKAALIDDLSGSLDAPVYSSSNYLTAKEHSYGALTSSKYTSTLAAQQAKVSISKKEVKVSGITASNKQYDGTTAAVLNVNNAQFEGKVLNDDINVVLQNGNTSGMQGSFQSKDVGNDKIVSLTNAKYGGNDVGNYTFVDQANTTANVSQNTSTTVILTGATGNKTYSGTTQSLTGLSKAEGLLGVDTSTNIGVTAVTSGKNVGSYTTTEFSNLADLEKNYANIKTVNGSLTIDQNTTAKVVLTANSATKTYTGASQSINGLVSTGLLGDDKADNGGVKASTSGTVVGTHTDTVFENLATLKKNYANVTTQNGTLTINAQAPKPPIPDPIKPNVSPVKPSTPANPFQLAAAEDQAEEVCSPTSLESCFCEESPLNKGVDICYEPKTSGKSVAR